jgi:hypothetical protein
MRSSLPTLLVLVACGGSASSVDLGAQPGGGDGQIAPDGGTTDSGNGAATDSAVGDGTSAFDAQPAPGDGTPQRVTCTSTLGTGLNTMHGRLDGRLVALVPTTEHACNSDSTHLHLQIAMNGSTYDVAVNLDALTDELDAPLPVSAWTEGWHDTMQLDYVSNLGLHAGTFTAGTVDGIQQHLVAALANVNHISIFATGYGPDGAHLVHRQGGGRDGAIFIDPLSPKAHGFVFHFDTQTF